MKKSKILKAKRRVWRNILTSIVFALFGIAGYLCLPGYLLGGSLSHKDFDFFPGIDRFFAERPSQQVEEKREQGAARVPILIYHSVMPHIAVEDRLLKYYRISPQSFEKQLQYLKDNNYTVIGLDYLAGALIKNTPLPPKSVAVTLDDGWMSQHKYAFPLLKKYNYTATFFVFTGEINHAHFLSWDQLREMDKAGMTIGGHTETHPVLTQIKDVGALKREIIDGKHIIESHLGKTINIFAYPFGQYNEEVINIVKEAGYKVARGTYKGVYHTPDDLFRLKGIEATDDFEKFVKDLNR